MLAPFPRTSLYSSSHPHFQKHNKRLGKVSHQMQKIIDDIQGKNTELTDSKKIEPRRSAHRKNVEAREIEYAAYVQRRSQRRKSRKSPESGGEQREMACQTTMIELTPTKSARVSHLGTRQPQSQNSNSLVRSTRSHYGHKSNSLDRNSRSPDENHRKNIKRSKFAEDVKVKMAPWERPLPPVPGPEKQTTDSQKQTSDSQAKLYQKVFQTVSTRLKPDGKNLLQYGKKDGKTNIALFTPVKSISKQLLERNLQNDGFRFRYVDIENVSSDRKAKQKIGDSPVVKEARINEHSDEEHIYECIDDEDGYETISENPKARELFPISPITPGFRSRHSDIGLFTLGRTPLSAFRTFRHEDTYLEPVCSLEDIRCKHQYPRNSVCSDDQDSHYEDQISDFHGYTRDFVVSPSSSSVSDDSTTTIRATYV